MRFRLFVFFLIICAVCDVHKGGYAAPPAASEPTVTLKDVSYAQLEQAVRDLHGKVVVVDVWDTRCINCLKAFPHMLAMAKKYSDQGLVCLSVSVDSKDDREAALRTLQRFHSTITNYRLDEAPEVWAEKWNASARPINFVFDRDGRRVKRFDHEDPDASWGPEDVEKLVKELLAKKPR